MKTINIDSSVIQAVPQEFLGLPDVNYSLTKIQSFRDNNPFTGVGVGNTVLGPLRIVEVTRTGLPGVKVDNIDYNYADHDSSRYIRTSPIVRVVDKTDKTLTFETQGGVYKLEQVLDN